MAKVSNSREIARRAIREEIARAALTRFQQQGFEKTTVEEIAGDVGLSARTYFRYFASKDDVLLEPSSAFQVAFLREFSEHIAENTLWRSLELTLRQTALACDPEASCHGGFDVQEFIRQTPALLARQLALMEALQLEAANIYLANASKNENHDNITVQATVRCAFACLQALENHLPKGRQDEEASATLTLLMDHMMPCVLAWDKRP
ncbi:TetR/AcrR family transcriptional regulator [Novosphingobium sp. ZW T3_23]|uniref:TetR/AcrR family transcriptional regulator n=1 Tax=Novosphingobium sp. ZW T3_23 TaxID=3378084 RepID=UPI0038531B89